MDKVIWVLLCSSALVGMMLLLYSLGYLTVKSKSAIMYIGSVDGKRASFKVCTGFTKRVVRVSESGAYVFFFESDLEEGQVSAELLDAKQKQILCLQGTQTVRSVLMERGKRYYLVFRFSSASGSCAVKWELQRERRWDYEE